MDNQSRSILASIGFNGGGGSEGSSDGSTLIELGQDILQLEMQVENEFQTNLNYTAVIESLSSTLQLYTRVIAAIVIIIILLVGTVGNTMVMLVIVCSRDMRTSTNYFLVNLSAADLLVILIITPTALLEVLYHPDIWLFGPTMCKLVPVLELIVCHASVLTILAISFERYYAICSPLQANYVCTRARAVWICAVVWISAIVISSPTYLMTEYLDWLNENGEIEPKCNVVAGTFWPDFYTISTILLFFLLPLVILLITYWMISKRLTMDQSELTVKNENQRGRKQVVLMLGTVVFVFFLCLLPFRLLTLMVLLTDTGELLANHSEAYYNVLYFSRIMCYINSAINPILYNLFSTKFRNGFRRLCGRKGKQFIFHRNGTFLTLTTTTSVHLPLSINNNNTPTTISTSASTSPELTVSLVRKNGIRKLDCGHASLYRYSTHYCSQVTGKGRNSGSSSSSGGSGNGSCNGGGQYNWTTRQNQNGLDKPVYHHQMIRDQPISSSLVIPTSCGAAAVGRSRSPTKKEVLCSNFMGRRNESML